MPMLSITTHRTHGALAQSAGGHTISRGRNSAAQAPAAALVADLLAYAPALLLVADLGTLQGDGSPCVAGDPLTAACATWQDQSGNGNHATQTTVTARPALTVNGRTSIVFDGFDDCLLPPNITVQTWVIVLRWIVPDGLSSVLSRVGVDEGNVRLNNDAIHYRGGEAPNTDSGDFAVAPEGH